MDYSVLHDAEINMKVCAVLGHGLSGYARIIRQGDATILLDDNETLVDYCNNPADAWPIIVGKKLSIINADDKWLCVPEDEPINDVTGDAVHMIYSGDGVEHENPLRAAMIVFLMMQDSVNVQTDSTR